MIDKKLLEVLTTPPDAACTIVTEGRDGPHAVNSWNSYIQITGEGCFLIPVGRMNKSEKNIENNSSVLLTIANREVQGKSYKGTGFLVKGTAKFVKDGSDFDTTKEKFPWARAALKITIISAEQTL